MLLLSQRKKVIEVANRAKQEQLIPLTMGNFSIRDKETGYICVTPSGMEYSLLEPSDIVIVDLHGKVIDGIRKPSIETPMHCAVYRKREDVLAIAHTHSTFATAWASCGKAIPVVVAEVATLLAGAVECAPYKRPGTEELAETVSEYLGDRNAVLLENHGLLAVGTDLDSAYANAVVAEEGAKIAIYAMQIGAMKVIPEEECKMLRKKTIEGYGQK
jgi:L-ribulose-5-phosphate 4-epimerase